MNYTNICKHYVETLIPSVEYNSNLVTRKLELLVPEFREKAIQLQVDSFKIFEAYRSNNRQLSLFNSRPKVTNIKRNGMHHYGIAVDVIPFIDINGDGKGDWIWKGDYEKLNKIAKKLGLTHLNFEQCHYQLIPANNEQNELRAQVDKYVKEWQKKVGLISDGIVGPKTIAKAKELYD